jgi:Transposase DDE domain group 1
VLLEHFIARHRREGTQPRALTLDMDSTDDPTHGQQEFASFHTHYGGHIFMQFLVHTSDGDLLFAAVSSPKLDLRASAVTFLGRIIKRLRAEWPSLKLRLRADNGFATPALYELCEVENVEYFVNCGTHQVLQDKAAALEAEAVRCVSTRSASALWTGAWCTARSHSRRSREFSASGAACCGTRRARRPSVLVATRSSPPRQCPRCHFES